MVIKEIAEAYSALSSCLKEDEGYDSSGTYQTPFKKGGYTINDLSSFKSFWKGIKDSTKVINTSIIIEFNESVKGAEKKVKYTFEDTCIDCVSVSSKYQKSSTLKTCSPCGGLGKTKRIQGNITVFLTCQNCRGSGELKKEDCKSCNNSRSVLATVKTTLKVPAGVVSGDTLRLIDKEKNIITLIKIKVSPSDKFIRKGNDIYSNLNISLKEALLGCSKEIQLVRDKVTIEIPECIPNNTNIRIKRQGACDVGGREFGNHYVKVNIKMPEKLTEFQKNIINQFDN